MDWPFGNLTPLRYRTILVDNPTRFDTWSAKGEAKSPQAKYECMTDDELMALPVNQLAAPDCIMIFWTTFPKLMDGLKVMQHWGFRYATGGTWAKQSPTGKKWAFGGGYVLRSASEPFLIGKLGDPPTLSTDTRNLIVAPVREHSRKPDQQYDLAEAIGAAPRCELFSRTNREGWDSFGDQSGMFGEAS